MKKQNYKLPLDISRFFSEKGGYLETCSELESIDQHIGLLLTTHCGEHGFDKEFGTRLWEIDFENIVSRSAWEDTFVKFISEAIQHNEKRLTETTIQIDVRDTLQEEASMQGYSVRKRVDIIILGTVISTGRQHGFKHTIYLGPLSRS